MFVLTTVHRITVPTIAEPFGAIGWPHQYLRPGSIDNQRYTRKTLTNTTPAPFGNHHLSIEESHRRTGEQERVVVYGHHLLINLHPNRREVFSENRPETKRHGLVFPTAKPPNRQIFFVSPCLPTLLPFPETGRRSLQK